MNSHCKNCGNPIVVIAYKGLDWCSERCQKVLDKRETVGNLVFLTADEERRVKQERLKEVS